MKIAEMDRIRQPDAVVACAPIFARRGRHQGSGADFEVLSPAASRVDRIDKFRVYRGTRSILRHIIPEPDCIAATADTRGGEDWIVRARLAGDLLERPDIAVVIPRSEIDAGVEPGRPGGEPSSA